ncbi:Crp/Fnr family transcriptional regulator [Spirosoma arcticum]
MDKEPLIQFIQQHVPATRQTVETIAGHFDERVLAKNEYLLKAGRISNEYFFLADGFVRAFTLDADGQEVTTNFFGKNRAVFEVSSLFMRTVSTETMQALTDSIVFVIEFGTLNTLFHSLPEFREFGRAMLVKEFAAFKQRTLSLINKRAEERYADLIETNGDLFQHAPLKYIASYLGITDTSLSRIRREFARKG